MISVKNNNKIGYIGAYDMERDTLVGILATHKNWMSFLTFLKWLRRRYPSNELLHVVLDNAGYHLKAEVLSYARKHRIKFYWTPTNASGLKRSESHFTALRKFALDNTDYLLRCKFTAPEYQSYHMEPHNFVGAYKICGEEYHCGSVIFFQYRVGVGEIVSPAVVKTDRDRFGRKFTAFLKTSPSRPSPNAIRLA